MRQLPVGKAFGHTVQSTINNLRFAFHISWPWMLLLLPFNIAGNIYTTLNYPIGQFKNLSEVPVDTLAVWLAMAAAAMVAFASIAVSWHRYILLDEVPHGLQRFRLDGTVLRYVGNVVGISLLSALAGAGVIIIPAIIASLAMALGWGGLIIAIPVLIAGLIFALGISVRLSIKLPAIAMQNDAVTLGRAWEESRENHWRCGILFALVILCLIAVGLVFSLLTSVLANSAATISIITLVVVQMVVNWVSTIWNVTVLTSLYGYFVERRDF